MTVHVTRVVLAALLTTTTNVHVSVTRTIGDSRSDDACGIRAMAAHRGRASNAGFAASRVIKFDRQVKRRLHCGAHNHRR